jgi:SAM-dependent methyltransferase
MLELKAPEAVPARLLRIARQLGNPASLPALIWKNITFPFSPQAAEKRYDRRMGIDTAGYIEASSLGIAPQGSEPAQPYGPTPPEVAKFLIGQIAARAKGFTFVDIGSGKGRVLLIAAEFPFRKVVGFEHSEFLNQIAVRNIRQFSALNPLATTIEVVTGDATLLPLPDGPLVLFLFNPLGPNALRDFAASLKSSYHAAPRKIICIYYNTAHPAAFEELGIFPIRRQVECPGDACDRYRDLKFQALVYETGQIG